MQSKTVERVSIPRLSETPPLALGPVDAFVLSKIDGRRSVGDLAVIVGLPREELEAILARLATSGALVVDTIELDDTEEDRESSRPTTPSSDNPFDRFDRATSPGEAPEDVLREAGGLKPRAKS